MKLQLKKNDFEILDSIRGMAALYVTIAHCRGTLWMGSSEYSRMFERVSWGVSDYLIVGSSMLTRLAVEFVIVFFVLSGFSITHSLAGDKSPLSFYKRRFIRIYPSYLAALVWAGLIYVVTKIIFPEWYDGTYTQFAFVRTMEMNEFFDPPVILGNLFYIPMHGFIGPFWSLTYEVIFYLLAPFLLLRINLYVLISALLFLINFLFPSMVSGFYLPRQVYEFIFIYNIYFAVGVYLYANFVKISGWFSSYTKFEFLLIFGGLLAIMFGANIYFKIETDFTFIEASMLSSVLIIFFLKYQFRVPALMQIGKFSYSLYITHFASIYIYLAIYWLIFKPTVPFISNYFVWIPAVFFVTLLGYLHYLTIERNTKNILNRLRRAK